MAPRSEDVFDLLAEDHEDLRRWILDLEDAKGGAGPLLLRLRRELLVHGGAEEEVVHAAYRALGEEAEVEAEEGVAEHHLVDGVVGELVRLAPGTPAFLGRLAVLKDAFERHVGKEEGEMLPELRATCTETEWAELARRVVRRKQGLRSRLPAAPDLPGREDVGAPERREPLDSLPG